MVNKKNCGNCGLFELLREDGYGKCNHPLANWPDDKGISGTYSDNPPAIVVDVGPKGEYIYCHKPKEEK